MCLHASWLKPAECGICQPRKRPANAISRKVVNLGVEKREPFVKRVSLLPTTYLPSPKPVNKPTQSLCVGCGRDVVPGMVYTGSVLSDLIHTSLKTSHTTPVLGVMQTYGYATPKGDVVTEKVLGGHTIEGIKRVSFRKRSKGYICDVCAACTTTVLDREGNKVPLVETDARGGFLGETSRGAEIESSRFRRGPAFNTRVTQGRRGKRV